MHNAKALFLANIRDADALVGIYEYLAGSVGEAISFDDLLRSRIVYSVSAFDKLLHDLIRVGIVQTYLGNRAATPKYQNEPIPLSVAQQLSSATTPPPEVIFEQIVRAKLKILSFQDPDKVSDGLSYIWPEPQKWQKIATKIGIPEATAKTTLRLIANRRNAIVHEADLDPVTGQKISISKVESNEVSSFLLNLGTAICDLVT
jgi:hypothetical protein